MNRPFILGLTGAVIIGAAIGLTFVVDRDSGKETVAVLKTPDRGTGVQTPDRARSSAQPAEDIRASAPAAGPANPGPATPDPVVTRPAVTDPAVLRPAITDPGTLGPTAANRRTPDVVTPRKPTFDVVRVNPRGDAVIAGRAAPDAAVVVRDGEKEIGKAKADARGEWVVVPKQPLATGSRELTLTSKSSDGTATRSDRNVVIVVPDKKPRNGATQADREPGALAVLVPRDGKGGSIVVQKPSGGSRLALKNNANQSGPGNRPDAARNDAPVSIDAVDYDEAGNVTISGNAAVRTRLRIYIDNRHSASGVSDARGRWRVVPGGALPPGIYTLRVDQIGPEGKVIGRAETQFTRSKPAYAAPSDAIVMVESGNSLWRIARRVYGAGIQYSVIFDANREQIRDPDMIYPGQVFFVPHVN